MRMLIDTLCLNTVFISVLLTFERCFEMRDKEEFLNLRIRKSQKEETFCFESVRNSLPSLRGEKWLR